MIRQDWSTLKKLMFMKAAAGGGSAAVERTATGNPLTFQTDLARPLKSLLIPFTPQQEGTGDPSPENIRPILPWNGLTAWNGGKNLFNKETVSTGVWWKGSVLSDYPNHRASALIPVKAGATYTVDRESPQQNVVNYFDKQGEFVDQITFDKYIKSRTIPDGVYFIGVTVGAEYLDSAMVYAGQTATAYEPYKWITETDISFPSPVYGGELKAVSGKLVNGWNKKTVAEIRLSKTADHIFSCYFSDRKYGTGAFGIISDTYKTITAVHSTGSTIETLYATYGDGIYVNAFSGTFYICDSRYTDDEEFKTAMADTVIVYELATPQEIQLTPAQITALVGDNTIWSDADGSMTCVYLVSSKYAEDHPVGGLSSGLGSGLLGSNPDPDEPIEDPEENPEE